MPVLTIGSLEGCGILTNSGSIFCILIEVRILLGMIVLPVLLYFGYYKFKKQRAHRKIVAQMSRVSVGVVRDAAIEADAKGTIIEAREGTALHSAALLKAREKVVKNNASSRKLDSAGRPIGRATSVSEILATPFKSIQRIQRGLTAFNSNLDKFPSSNDGSFMGKETDQKEADHRAVLKKKRKISATQTGHSVVFKVGNEIATVYEVKLNEVKLVKVLAVTNICEVYCAVWRETQIAVKLLIPDESAVSNLQEAIENFRREIHIMNELQHPNILRLVGASLSNHCYALMMEFMPNGSLYSFLRDPTNLFPKHFTVYSAQKIAEGMKYMHERNYIQRDLKSHNLLLSENFVIKIADFGLSRYKSEQTRHLYTHVGVRKDVFVLCYGFKNIL